MSNSEHFLVDIVCRIDDYCRQDGTRHHRPLLGNQEHIEFIKGLEACWFLDELGEDIGQDYVDRHAYDNWAEGLGVEHLLSAYKIMPLAIGTATGSRSARGSRECDGFADGLGPAGFIP